MRKRAGSGRHSMRTRGHQAARLVPTASCLRRQPDLERDHAGRQIVARYIHGRHENDLARGNSHEIDQRQLIGERGPERAVVGLVDRPRAVVVEDRAACRSMSSSVRRRLPGRMCRGQKRQRRRPDESPRAIDPILQ